MQALSNQYPLSQATQCVDPRKICRRRFCLPREGSPQAFDSLAWGCSLFSIRLSQNGWGIQLAVRNSLLFSILRNGIIYGIHIPTIPLVAQPATNSLESL